MLILFIRLGRSGYLKDAFVDIDKRLQGFIGNKTTTNIINPLEESKEIVLNLSNLYQFKKEIELDNNKEEIYDRLSQVFINQFNIESFTFIEINTIKQKMTIVKEMGNVNGEQNVALDLSNNASGIYMVQIVTDRGTITKRLTLRSK